MPLPWPESCRLAGFVLLDSRIGDDRRDACLPLPSVAACRVPECAGNVPEWRMGGEAGGKGKDVTRFRL